MQQKKTSKPNHMIWRLLKWFTALLFLLILTFAIAAYFFLQELNKELPDIELLQNVQYQTPLNIYSQDGLLIAQFGEMRRIPKKISEIPRQQILAFLAAEDDRFYKHPGVDHKALLRAAKQLLKTGKKRQGGSTITMQVARNFLLSNEKTYLRKLKEIILSIKIEQRYSKDQILELYLNKIYMGHRAYGVASAAQTYYGKPLEELDLHQQAMIAGLPKAPSLYNPIANPARALERRNYVLQRMLELNFISQNEFDLAINKPDNAEVQNPQIELEAPYIAEMVRQELIETYGDEAYTLGLRVYTTVPSHLQRAADRALQYALHLYDERHGYRGLPHKNIEGHTASDSLIGDTRQAVIALISASSVSANLSDGSQIQIPWKNLQWAITNLQNLAKTLKPNDIIWVRQLDDQSWALSQIPGAEAAFAAIDANNGAVLALSGGFDYLHNHYNRATQSKRQPGSGFKPFIYTAALEKGFTVASLINDAPIAIEDPSISGDWRPENYTHKFRGPTPLRVALRESINLVSVRLLQEIGIEKAVETALRFGFDRNQLPTTLSLALGSGHATPLRMASAYATFANGGFQIKPYLINRIEDVTGKLLFIANPAIVCETNCAAQNHPALRVITPEVHFLMHSLLRDVVERGTATQAKQLNRQDIAGKTGTTNEQRDAWFNGYAGNIAASAWIGFDNSSPLGKGETGGKVALPLWLKFMETALTGVEQKSWPMPSNITQALIDPNDGLLAKQGSANGVTEYFVEGSEPKTFSAPRLSDEESNKTTELEESLF